MIRPPRSWFSQHGLDDFVPMIDDVLIRKNNAAAWAQQCRRLMRSVNPELEFALQRDLQETLAEYERQHRSLRECLSWLYRDANAVFSRGNRAAAALKQLIEAIRTDDLPTPQAISQELTLAAQRAREDSAPEARIGMTSMRVEIRPRPRRGAPVGRPEPEEPQGTRSSNAMREYQADPDSLFPGSAPPRERARSASARAADGRAARESVAPAAEIPSDPIEARFSLLDVEWD